MSDKPPIINIDEVPLTEWGHGVEIPGLGPAPEGFSARMGRASQLIGAKQLGYNVTIIPPGCKAFPYHSHRVNEELFYIIEGVGELRLGNGHHPLRSGDFVNCPAGGPDTAHQIRNTSETDDLKFLAISTTRSPEVAEYPDSGKFNLFADFGKDSDGNPDMIRHVDRFGTGVDYWDGEE
jgi:uncharacterized cupin superfamily protein